MMWRSRWAFLARGLGLVTTAAPLIRHLWFRLFPGQGSAPLGNILAQPCGCPSSGEDWTRQPWPARGSELLFANPCRPPLYHGRQALRAGYLRISKHPGSLDGVMVPCCSPFLSTDRQTTCLPSLGTYLPDDHHSIPLAYTKDLSQEVEITRPDPSP
ncbi:hypothetical protein B0T11DRAFT_84044 [Plectosphaerella cucumerina]|uniref:Uncharacterized protein n=1 Tax=Plectosphaerella cucumerina TaxID=40658 RepID=A0A8K0X371_9PEZI|nr:hypothetical protein B0T11DRAFT_84044 [Plectosphaerella cucumerina]